MLTSIHDRRSLLFSLRAALLRVVQCASRLTLATSAMLLPSVAPAMASCPPSDRPVVELQLEVTPPDWSTAKALEEHLTAELGARAIDVCERAAPRTAIARIQLRIEHLRDGAVIASIRIGDRITDKRVERQLVLTRIPADSHPMAVAAATDELLRASWAELVVADAPQPAMAAPPAVTRAVARSLDTKNVSGGEAVRSRDLRWELGLLVEGSFSNHREALGGGLMGTRWLDSRFAVMARVGATWGRARIAEHGRGWIDAQSGNVGIAVAPWSRGTQVGLRLEASVGWLHAVLDSTPDEGAQGSPRRASSPFATTGARAWLDTGPLRWSLGIAGLVPFRSIRATDSGKVISTIQGIGAEVALAAAWKL